MMEHRAVAITAYPIISCSTTPAFECCCCTTLNPDLTFNNRPLYAVVYHCHVCGHQACEAHNIDGLCYGCSVELGSE